MQPSRSCTHKHKHVSKQARMPWWATAITWRKYKNTVATRVCEFGDTETAAYLGGRRDVTRWDGTHFGTILLPVPSVKSGLNKLNANNSNTNTIKIDRNSSDRKLWLRTADRKPLPVTKVTRHRRLKVTWLFSILFYFLNTYFETDMVLKLTLAHKSLILIWISDTHTDTQIFFFFF